MAVPVKHRHPEDGLRLSAAAHGSPPDPLTDLSVRGFLISSCKHLGIDSVETVSTQTRKKRLTDVLKPQLRWKSQVDDGGSRRTVWQRCCEGRDWLVLGAQQGGHFDFRENILQGIERNRNPDYAILLGSKAENWYVFQTDLMPLVKLILERKIRRVPQPDGSIYYELDYEISMDTNMCLTAYHRIKLVEMPEWSKLVNHA